MANHIPAANVRLKRAYEPAEAADGPRILVDRLWPRGVSKEDARIDDWVRDIAPSTGLRTWFGHDPARWAEFRRRYLAEIKSNPESLARLRGLARKGAITRVYSARDTAHNDAVVLRAALLGRMGG
jgi:uncharacterized protein YeaO (DUF488 family)